MAVTDSAVQIVINVFDGNSGEVISRIERGLGNIGAAGSTSGAQAAKAMKDIASGAKNAADNMEGLEKAFTASEGKIRTASAEIRSLQGSLFGDTRAASEFLVSIKGVGAAMELAFPIFGAVALAGVLVDAGKKAYELYEKFLDVNAAAKEYSAELEKARQQDFGNTRSIEDTTARVKEATDAMRHWQEVQRQNDSSFSFNKPLTQYIAGKLIATDASQKVVDQQKMLDDLRGHVAEQAHQTNVQAIEREHALDSELRGQQKINAELSKKIELDAEDRRYSIEQDRAHGNTVAPDAGKAEMDTRNAIALGEAEAQTFNLRREQTHELMQLRNEATDAALRGSALYRAQEEQAIEELKYKDMDSTAAREAVHARFHAEEMKRLREEQDAVAKRAREADTAGLTGLAKIQAEGKNRDQDIVGDAADGKYASLADAQQDRVTNQKKTLAEMQAAEESFAQRVDQVADQSAQHQVSGFARINAEAKKQLDDLQKSFDQTYGKLDRSSPEFKQGQSELERGQAAIHGGAAQQSSDLARKNAEETSQIEAEARSKFLSAEKQKTAAIETEYEQRLKKYKDQLDQQEISWEDYNRRVAAAGEQRDAEMVEAAKQARQKMASEFSSFFEGMNHPLQELQKLGEKAAGQAAAAMVQRMQQHAGKGSPQSGNPGGGFLSEIFGVGKMPHGHGNAATSTHELGGGNKMIAVSTAQIHVQSASFGFGSTATSPTSSGLGGAGLPAAVAGGSITGVATDVQNGIGFAQSASRVFGGGASSGGGGAGSPAPGGQVFTGTGSASGSSASSGASGGAGAFADIDKSIELGQQMKGIFGGGSKSSGGGVAPFSAIDGPNDPLGLNKNSAAPGSTSSMLGGGGIMANAGGAATGALGLYSAYEGNGGVGGALGGAMSGMQLGMAVGGPVGAAVGAAAGAILGVLGPGGAEKARVYDLKQVRPRIVADQDAYHAGSMDYLAAYSDLQSLDMEAKKATNAMGMVGQRYYQDNIKKELKTAEAKFTAEERSGRSRFTASAATFDVGSDFVPRDGMAMIHQGERIMPSDQNERITQAIEGASTMPADSGSGGDVHIHMSAIDAKSGMQFLMANKHHIRSAVNASYSENSGGSDA